MKPMKMKKLIAIAACIAALGANAENVREKTLMNDNWKFALGHAANPEKDFHYGQALSFSKIAFLQESTMLMDDEESRLRIPHTQSYPDSAWATVQLPHDWGMSLGFDPNQLKMKGYRKLGGRNPENSVGWYRKTFTAPLDKGSRYTLEFEGIFRDAQIWVNGVYQGKGESGYVPLVFDVTESLNYGDNEENVITVRVDATQSELWSYEGAGIYRNVWLTRTAPVHVAQWGTFVSSDVDLANGSANVSAEIEVTNDGSDKASVEVVNTILDKDGKAVATARKSAIVKPLETEVVATAMPMAKPHLWSVESPYMYKLRTDVLVDGNVVDTYDTDFGVRHIRFDADKGFFLNGEHVLIKGVCCHQDHAGVGVAVPDNLNAWRIKRLKDYGTNAYRPSHNPPTEAVLNACDTLGMLVMDELRVLSSSKQGLEELATILRRDRNHPSVILWCMGNEEPVLQCAEKGQMMVGRMKALQQKLDPTRGCTAAMNGTNGEGFTKAVDVQGYNYFVIHNIDGLHKRYPELPTLLTEEASTLTTRGIYATQPEKDFHQAYDNDRPGWGSTAQQWMRYVDENPFVSGAFVWTGFDYGGEAHGYFWPGVVSNFGIVDYCGFPKDAYYYYKAWWGDEPVLHVLPHWNGVGADSVDVHVYTNLDEVELVLNGKSLGKKAVGKFDVPAWRVKYVPGKLVAKGKKDGKKYVQTVSTTGAAAKVMLASENGLAVSGDGREAAIITVAVADRKGIVVPTADNYVNFSVKNGRVLGVGNGNPSCQEPDVFAEGEKPGRSVFSGYAQLLVASDGSGKPIEIEAQSDGLAGDVITIDVK